MPQSLKLRPSEAAAILEPDRIKPEFGVHVIPLDMNMRGLMTIRGVKEKPIGSTSENGRHRLTIYILSQRNTNA
jgi:hypothetical protein